MSLDLTQNIILYLVIIISMVSIFLMFKIIRIGSQQRKSNKTLKRLRYEITKMQDIDGKILKSLTDETPIFSWIDEDKHHKEQKKLKKQQKLQKRKDLFYRYRKLLPENIEQFTGEQILDKVGIASFLIGLALFINVSMELEWINNFGRLFFGIFLTIIFLITGYIIRKKFVHFSNILIGGGIASFIFAVFSAYYQYHIIPLPIWIITTIFIVLTTIIISISVKRHEIVIITFVAAYLAPFTVKFMSTDYIILFSYLTVLNLGILVYDFYQKSIVVNLVSFGFTFMTYGIWLISKIYFKQEDVPYLGAFIFLTLFYIMFVFIVIINNLREGKEFHKMDFSIMMMAKGIYLSVGLMIIKQSGADLQGLFAGLIGIINFSFYLGLYNKKNFDRRILNQFLALSIMFFALIIPFEFYGKTITMAWALQAVVLMFISVRSKLDSMKLTSFYISVAMIVSLFIEMYNQYISTTGTFEYIHVFLNRSFLSSLLAMASMVSILFLLPQEEYFIKKFIKTKHYKIFLGAILAVTFYMTFFLEIKTAAVQKFETIEAVNTVVSIYNIGFLTLVSLPVILKKMKPLAYAAIGVAIVSSLIYIFYYSGIYVNLRNGYLLSSKITKGQFTAHYITLVMIALSLFSALKNIRVAFEKPSRISFALSIILVFFAVYIFSAEVTNYFTVKLYEPHLLVQDIVFRLHRFSYSVTWGIISLLVLISGFLFKSQEARIISISLYAITLLKIIVFDFWTATNQDLMISFAVMGFIMLISSFLFQLNKTSEQKAQAEIK